MEFSILICKDICNKLKTDNCKKIIEEWKNNAIFDIKITKRDDERGKLYKPLDIDFDGNLNVIDDDGKKEILEPQFPFNSKNIIFWVKLILVFLIEDINQRFFIHNSSWKSELKIYLLQTKRIIIFWINQKYIKFSILSIIVLFLV